MESSTVELFSSQFSSTGQVHLTSAELREVKQKLLSGDEVKLMQSLEKIETYLSNEESALQLLGSDITDFICDALLPSNAVVLSCAIKCLEYLLKYEEFFSQSHSCVVVESVSRCLFFLLKNPSSASSLSQCLQLLICITQGYNNYQVNPEKKTVEIIVQILDEFLKNNTVATYNKYQIGHVILGLLNLNSLLVLEEILETIFTMFSCWFDGISNVFKSDHPMGEDVTILCCLLCHSVVKCLVLQNTVLHKFGSNTETQLKESLLSKIIDFIINIWGPYLDVQFPTVVENESPVLDNFLQTILYFYSDDLTPQKNYLAHALGEIGFIQFASRIISCSDFNWENKNEKCGKLSILTLLHIILTLSEEVFQFLDEGFDNFRNEIQLGFSQLPLDASQWLDTLSSPDSSFSCKFALLLYLYFYCLTAKSQDILKTIYPSIVVFIEISSFEIGFMSTLFLKIVWFIYVVSQLSHTEAIFPEKESVGFRKLVSVLVEQENLSLVYTHHPAFIYWAFSFELDYSFQKKIVFLWLLNKTPDCRIINKVMKKSTDVKYVILDILQNECGQVLECAFESLKLFLNETDDDSLVSSIWVSLPQTLAKYTTDSASATNVDYIIELANMRNPKNVDSTKIMRLASLLPQVLTKSDLLSVVPTLTLTLKVLEQGFEMNDVRVFHVFLRFDGYVRKIIKNFDTHSSEILVICLKIIKFLWKNCSKLCKPGSNSIVVILAGLNFLQEVLLTAFESNIFVISDADSDFVEILFLEVQNISIRNIPEAFSACWSCLKSFLLLGEKRKELKDLDLMSNPFLNEVIEFHLPRLHHSTEMKDFLKVWLDQNRLKLSDSCFDRKIFGGFFQATLRKVLRCLEDNFKADEDAGLYKAIVEVMI